MSQSLGGMDLEKLHLLKYFYTHGNLVITLILHFCFHCMLIIALCMYCIS